MLNPRLEEPSATTPSGASRRCWRRSSRRRAATPIDLSIGQPMHPLPPLLVDTLRAHGHLWGRYPPVVGTPAFREAAARLARPALRAARRARSIPTRHVLPVAGTKEALFLIAQAVVPERKAGRTAGGAAAEPVLQRLSRRRGDGRAPSRCCCRSSAETGYLPALDDLSPALLERTAAFYLCSPANPQGAAADLDYLAARARAGARATISC